MTNKHIELPALSDEQIKQVLTNSDLWDMHQHMGWYSAPEKNFKTYGVMLARDLIAARDDQWTSAIAAHEQARVVGEPVASDTARLVMAAGIANQYGVLEDRAFACAERILALASHPAPQEVQAELIERFAQAAHWCINASEQEMQEQCDTRESALRRVHAISGKLLASGFAFVSAAPGAQPATEPRSYEDLLTPENLRAWGHPVAQQATDQAEAPSDGDFVMLDDDGKAMMANSHHYTVKDIRALIDDLKSVEQGTELPEWINRDHRTRCGVIWRVMAALASDVPVAPLTEAERNALATQPTASNAGEREAFNAVYDQHCNQPGLTIREIAWRCYRAALASKPAEPVAPSAWEALQPYGRVTVVRRPGCVDQHWFYPWPDPPYLDNAAECHTVYTTPAPAGQTDTVDAERYRWLRDKSVPPHNFYISVPDEFHGVRYKTHDVDAYIDDAIRAARGDEVNQK